MATKHQEFAPLERLIDESRARPGEELWVRARAVELVECVDPIHFSVGRKQRLLLSLGQGWLPRRAGWLRPVVVGALLIGSGAIASAALTNWPAWLVRSCQTLISRRIDSGSSARPPVVRASVTTESPAAEPIPPMALRSPAVVRRLATGARLRRPASEPASDDPSLLIEATRALRVDRDPGLARALASRYLERQPRGALADEALAISIEAAIDRHDADAAALSLRYLEQFPRGSFRGLAERTLASPESP
jgi:hypothetical protein